MSTAKAGGLRVVLDTNVYFSAFTHTKGVPFRIWQQAVAGQYILLTSPAIMREVANVLRQKLGWQESEIVAHLKLIARVAEIVTPTAVAAVFQGGQEADNRILECAVAGRADLIVSGDRDLQRLKVYENMAVVRPVDFYRTLGLSA
jgi:uncharacterized protein